MDLKRIPHGLGIGMAALMLLVACSAAQEVQPTPETPESPKPAIPRLPDLGKAPEITNEVWINADTPITLASQRGNVVLLEFWTFG